ncbi:MAG: type II toxin-antitoxin system RelE/ParE family toxin [Terriglobales bacterium]
MKRYRVAPEAEDDLRQIWRYLLGEAGLAIANRIQGELVDAFETLADVPGKGHKRPDLTPRDVLFFSVYQYMIVYRRAELLEVVAVLHGKRDVKRLLESRASL